jgi:hypothetical protein
MSLHGKKGKIKNIEKNDTDKILVHLEKFGSICINFVR